MTDPILVDQDQVVKTVAILCEAEIKGELGDEHLQTVFTTPYDVLKVGGSNDLPSLAIYIHAEKEERRSSTQLREELLVVFDYVRMGVSTPERKTGFPPLRHVWRSIRNVLHRRSHPTLNNGDDILCGLAATDTVEGTAKVQQYSFLGSESYPWFRAQVMLTHTPDEGDAAALADFLEHFTDFREPGGEPHDDPDNPVTDTTILPPFIPAP